MATSPDDELTRAPVSTVAPTAASLSIDAAVRQAAPRHRFAPGSIIAGRYQVLALLGRGGNELGTTNTLIVLFPLIRGAPLTTALTRSGLLTLVVAPVRLPRADRGTVRSRVVRLHSRARQLDTGWPRCADRARLLAARGGRQVFGRLLPE